MNKVHYSSKSTEWETPKYVFDVLKEKYNIVLDTCATEENTKCTVYYDKKADGLKQNWSVVKEFGKDASCWMNPPYGRSIAGWVKKAHEETFNGVRTIALLPARTDTRWFHEYIIGRYEVSFWRGRIKFANAKTSAPFPSMIVIFEPLSKKLKFKIKFLGLFNKDIKAKYKELWKK